MKRVFRKVLLVLALATLLNVGMATATTTTHMGGACVPDSIELPCKG